ncbi:UDP-N-acetylglucosamine 1-carboxyvinyltransferase [Coprinopsis marcescibilis]|uniref:uracil phosphoribosyltransferase n=1 Tax=Coprinopsis marcescibilis TaxID=230819 RepID=A0A5C3L9N2_COPMA|nr:UDP-N-acetylglucosamine 1-carboxyvinyltransferase [Coprinopsis marcescibilis]
MANNLRVLNHPLVNAQLSKLRDVSTPAKEFREGVHNISLFLGYEASRGLEETTFEAKSPVAPFVGSVVKPRIGLTPILRAGLGMAEALVSWSTVTISAPVYHLGIYREKVTLQPVEYYSKLPPSPPIDNVLLLDPLIATGGTVCAALSMLVDWGIPIKNIKLLAVLASQEGLKHIQHEYPDLELWVAGVDDTLTEDGIISPGLGDSGDRLFNTLTNAQKP